MLLSLLVGEFRTQLFESVVRVFLEGSWMLLESS